MNINKQNRGKVLHIFDFDDTLAHTDSVVKVTRGDQALELDSHAFADYSYSPGDELDFSDFGRVKGELIAGPLALLFKASQQPDADVYIVTARPPEAIEGIQRFFSDNNLKPPPIYATSGSKGKIPVLSKLLSSGIYRRVIVYEDSMPNIEALAEVAKDYSVPYTAFLIQPDTQIRKMYETGLSITTKQLRQIIKEELNSLVKESYELGDFVGVGGPRGGARRRAGIDRETRDMLRDIGGRQAIELARLSGSEEQDSASAEALGKKALWYQMLIESDQVVKTAVRYYVHGHYVFLPFQRKINHLRSLAGGPMRHLKPMFNSIKGPDENLEEGLIDLLVTLDVLKQLLNKEVLDQFEHRYMDYSDIDNFEENWNKISSRISKKIDKEIQKFLDAGILVIRNNNKLAIDDDKADDYNWSRTMEEFQ